jgi:hypothetical protein
MSQLSGSEPSFAHIKNMSLTWPLSELSARGSEVFSRHLEQSRQRRRF